MRKEQVTIKIRVSTGCFHRQHSPIAYKIIDSYMKEHPSHDYTMIEHESGPEIITWIHLGAATLTFASSVFIFVATIINARAKGRHQGDTKDGCLTLIIRDTIKTDTSTEEVVLNISDMKCVTPTQIQTSIESILNKKYGRNISVLDKLYGREREIVEAIHNKSDLEAKDALNKKYNEIANIRDELNSLAKKGYIYVEWDIFQGCHLSILPDCKTYIQREADYEAHQRPFITVHAQGNQGNINIAGGDATNINQSVNCSSNFVEMLEHISALRNLIEVLNVDDNIKSDFNDNLYSIQRELTSQSPDWSLIKREKGRVEKLLDSIKDVTTITTLMVHFNALEPLIVSAMQAAGIMG